MRFWAVMTGGLLIWAVHFLGLYLLASAADVSKGDAAAWNAAGLVFSLVCLLSVIGLCWRGAAALKARPADDTGAFGLRLAIAGGLLGGIGVVFQSLVLLTPA